MRGITILDRGFDLRDILSVLGDDVERSVWTAMGVECLGEDAAAALERASDGGEVLPGSRLRELACDDVQIVDGEFSGRLPDQEAAWIVIRAVDSSAFDVETDREDVLEALRSRFERVEDLQT